MTRETWITQCAYRLVHLYGWSAETAQYLAYDLANRQAIWYGPIERWMPPFAAADECGRDGE